MRVTVAGALVATSLVLLRPAQSAGRCQNLMADLRIDENANLILGYALYGAAGDTLQALRSRSFFREDGPRRPPFGRLPA